MNYSNIKSPYIKSLIKKRKWSDRKYIDDLILLHSFMTKGISSYIAANLYSDLKFLYRKEFLKLIEEDIIINPNEKRISYYPKIIREFNNQLKRYKQHEDNYKECVLNQKKMWLNLGGLI